MQDTKSLQDLVDAQARAFVAGEFDAMLPNYADTLTVYGEDTILRFVGRDEVRRSLADHRDRARQEGMVNMSGLVSLRPLEAHDRMRFTVRWTYDMGPSASQRLAESTYYCTRLEGRYVIEMIEFRRLAFRDALDWYEDSNFRP